MHSIRKASNGTWNVVWADGPRIVPLFKGLKVAQAMHIAGVLNGGPLVDAPPEFETFLKVHEA